MNFRKPIHRKITAAAIRMKWIPSRAEFGPATMMRPRLTRAFISALLSGGIESVERAGRIDQRGAGIDGDRGAQGFRQFLLRGAQLAGGVGMDGDTTVAAQRYGDG